MLSFSLSPSSGQLSSTFPHSPFADRQLHIAQHTQPAPPARPGTPGIRVRTHLSAGYGLPLPCHDSRGRIPSSSTPYPSLREVLKVFGAHVEVVGRCLEDCQGFGSVRGAPASLGAPTAQGADITPAMSEIIYLMMRQRKPREKNRREQTRLEGSLGCCAMMLRDPPFCSSSSPWTSVAFPTQPGHNSVREGWGCHALSCRARRGHASQGVAWQPQQALHIDVILE